MRTNILLSSLLGVATGLAACGGGGSADVVVEPGASLVVVNDSDFAITQIFLTTVDSTDWGPNLLRGDVLLPSEQIALGVPCDTYDALVVDEDNVDCEIDDVDLCLNDATWVIRNNTCPVFAAEAAKRAAQKTATP